MNNSRLHKYLGIGTALVALFATTSLSLSVNAQSSQPNAAPVKGGRTWGVQTATPRRTEQPLEYQANKLDRDVSLPNVPTYTGKQKFISGFIYPNAKQGPGYYLIYNTEHTESQVKDWWNNALSMDPWKINFTDASTVKAMAKDGSTCSIVVARPCYADNTDGKGMRGSYSIFYHVVQKR